MYVYLCNWHILLVYPYQKYKHHDFGGKILDKCLNKTVYRIMHEENNWKHTDKNAEKQQFFGAPKKMGGGVDTLLTSYYNVYD